MYMLRAAAPISRSALPFSTPIWNSVGATCIPACPTMSIKPFRPGSKDLPDMSAEPSCINSAVLCICCAPSPSPIICLIISLYPSILVRLSFSINPAYALVESTTAFVLASALSAWSLVAFTSSLISISSETFS